MSRITIRKYETDGMGFLAAEIIWNPSDPDVGTVIVRKNLPDGGIASLAVIPSSPTSNTGYITVPIYPDDVPQVDVFSLPINLSGPLPQQLIGANLPSIYYPGAYVISALTDTTLGFGVTNGTPPAACGT